MRKAIKAALTIAAAAIIAAPAANAQFSKLLKKAQKAAEQVEQIASPTTEETATSTAPTASKSKAMANGGTIDNPMSNAADIELVGAYGTSTSTNYGKVTLVFKVNMKLNESHITMGGKDGGGETMAVDDDGNSYTTYWSSGQRMPITEGVPMKLELDKQTFDDVKKSVTSFKVIKVSVYINAKARGQITLRDVPIQWDDAPEK